MFRSLEELSGQSFRLMNGHLLFMLIFIDCLEYLTEKDDKHFCLRKETIEEDRAVWPLRINIRKMFSK